MDKRFCEARVKIPAEMAPLLWQLVGGEDAGDLRSGIVRACEIATSNASPWTNSHERFS
jgi:hypothetical protein